VPSNGTSVRTRANGRGQDRLTPVTESVYLLATEETPPAPGYVPGGRAHLAPGFYGNPTSLCHAYRVAEPGVTACGLSTEGWFLWPDGFLARDGDRCPECARVVGPGATDAP
jgi:hypothetical protein